MLKFEKGDKVTIHDFSYAVVIDDGKFRDLSSNGPDSRGIFTVVETCCKTPLRRRQNWRSNHPDGNDTIIQSDKSGRVVLIENRFLAPALHQITIDGRTVEISHESYTNLRRSLL